MPKSSNQKLKLIYLMKIPVINWIPFDPNDPPTDLYDTDYLIFLREDNLSNGKT